MKVLTNRPLAWVCYGNLSLRKLPFGKLTLFVYSVDKPLVNELHLKFLVSELVANDLLFFLHLVN